MRNHSKPMTEARLKGLSLVPALFSAAALAIAIGCERPPQGTPGDSEFRKTSGQTPRLIESRNPPQAPAQPLRPVPTHMRRMDLRTLIAVSPPSAGTLPAPGALPG